MLILKLLKSTVEIICWVRVSDIVGNLVWFVLVCPWAMGPWVAPWAKRKKPKRLPEPVPKHISLFWAPGLGNITLLHTNTASPLPLACTHDTNTKRNENRFPDWGSASSTYFPQSLADVFGFSKYEGSKIFPKRMLDLWSKRSETSIVFGPKFPK